MYKRLKILYNIIMYLSLFMAVMGVYCHITYNFVDDSSIIYYFIFGVIFSIFMILLLRHLFLQLHRLITMRDRTMKR